MFRGVTLGDGHGRGEIGHHDQARRVERLFEYRAARLARDELGKAGPNLVRQLR